MGFNCLRIPSMRYLGDILFSLDPECHLFNRIKTNTSILICKEQANKISTKNKETEEERV